MGEPLALFGGPPASPRLIPYGRQWLDEEDVRAVVEVLRSDWLTTGPKVAEFEERFAAWVGARYAVAVSSGTAALHAAAFAAGLGPGDEAITSPLTFAASANCVLYQGGRPVFVDVRPDTLNIDPAQVERRITPFTRALIPVDFAGQPCDLEEIVRLARRHGLVVIEDAAHALGATYRGRKVGSLADLTTFSFHPVKQITTGEGGMVTTDDPELARRLRLFRNHGITTEARERQERGGWFYEMVELGYNYRITDFQCALGLRQLEKLEGFLARRREIASRYQAAFSGLPEAELPVAREDRDSAWHLYILNLNLERLRVNRDPIFAALRAENLGVNVHYIPVHLHPYYQKRFGHQPGEHPVAEAAYPRLLTLPLFPQMGEEEVEAVIAGVRKVLQYYSLSR